MSTAFVELLRKSNLDYIITRKPLKIGSRNDEILFASFIDLKIKKLQLIACLDKSDSVIMWSTVLDERAFQLNARLLDITELSETMIFLSKCLNESDFTLTNTPTTTSNDTQHEVSQINITFTHSKNKQSITLQLSEQINETEKASFLSKILLHTYKRNEELSSEIKIQQLRINELSTRVQRSNTRKFDNDNLLDTNLQKGELIKTQERTHMSLINPTTKRRKLATGAIYDDEDTD